jgi:hypothetical protein
VRMLLIGAVSLAASLLVAAVVTVASLLQTPKYEASARVLVGQAFPRPPSDGCPHLFVEVKFAGYIPFPFRHPKGSRGSPIRWR